MGTDSGFIYRTFSFEYIREPELLREAGLNLTETFRSATLYEVGSTRILDVFASR